MMVIVVVVVVMGFGTVVVVVVMVVIDLLVNVYGFLDVHRFFDVHRYGVHLVRYVDYVVFAKNDNNKQYKSFAIVLTGKLYSKR